VRNVKRKGEGKTVMGGGTDDITGVAPQTKKKKSFLEWGGGGGGGGGGGVWWVDIGRGRTFRMFPCSGCINGLGSPGVVKK